MGSTFTSTTLTDADIEFIANVLGIPEDGRTELHGNIEGDEAARKEVLGDERLFRSVLKADDSLTYVSPRLFFEVLLRHAVDDLKQESHTVEREGSQRLPVFDVPAVMQVVSNPEVLAYLASMLASFTRIESYTTRVWIRRGIVRKIRYSDLDVHSLSRLLHETDEAERMPLYQRIADLCLFILGMFPDYPATANRYPGTGALRPYSRSRPRLSTEEYEALGEQMYGLAADHPDAARSGISELLKVFRDHVIEAKKPLNFLSEHYLGYKRQALFGWGN